MSHVAQTNQTPAEAMIEATARAMREAMADPKDGPLKPFETAPSRKAWLLCSQAAARVIVEACAKRAFNALEKLGEPTQALIVSDALRALLENENA